MVKGSKFNADDNNNLDNGRWLKKNKCCEGMQLIRGKGVIFAKNLKPVCVVINVMIFDNQNVIVI